MLSLKITNRFLFNFLLHSISDVKTQTTTCRYPRLRKDSHQAIIVLRNNFLWKFKIIVNDSELSA